MAFRIVDDSRPKKPLKKRNRNSAKKSMNKWLKRLAIVAGILIIGFGVYKGYEVWNDHRIYAEAMANQKADSKAKDVSTHADKLANKDISFDQNNDIPDAKTLKKYRSQSDNLSLDGYIAVPKQKGVTTPISTLQINEGDSNKVLAYGAGTVKPNQIMGQGKYVIASHTVKYGSGKLMFSPMQHAIDVDQQPKVYLTDLKKIYVYQLNKSSDDPAGDQSIPFKNNAKIAEDSTIKDGIPEIAMVTCDERGLVFNLHPDNRIVMTGKLIRTIDIKYATESEKALFPALSK